MCGRYATSRTSADLAQAFEAGLVDSAGVIEANFNVAPTTSAPLVIARLDDPDDPDSALQRELGTARWGLVPSWAKDVSIGSRMINARVETVHEKPSFRRAFATRRAIVPADGYFEWYQPPEADGTKPPKQPFYLSAVDGSVLGLAGLYEWWRPRDEPDAPWIISFTILTTAAEGEDGRLHDRAPLLVPAEAMDHWLRPAAAPAGDLVDLLIPATPGHLQAWPVSTAVNSVRNNGPALIEPIAAE